MSNMLPRTLVVRRCSACRDFLYHYRRREESVWVPLFNRYILWTDGKISYCDRIADPELVLCPHCRGLLWVSELECHGKIHGLWQRWEGGGKLACYREPGVRDYTDLLEQGAGSKVKEHYARLALWWARNDARRRPSSKAPGPGFRERTNMTALAELLDEADACHRVVKAELMRELGLLEGARALLATPLDPTLLELAHAIGALVAVGDTRVAEVGTGGGPPGKRLADGPQGAPPAAGCGFTRQG